MANLYTIDSTNTPVKTDLVLLGQADKERSATLNDSVQGGLEVWQKGIPEDFDDTGIEKFYQGADITYDIEDINNRRLVIRVSNNDGTTIVVFINGLIENEKYFFDMYFNYNTDTPTPKGITFKVRLNNYIYDDLFGLSDFITVYGAFIGNLHVLNGWYQYKNGFLIKL